MVGFEEGGMRAVGEGGCLAVLAHVGGREVVGFIGGHCERWLWRQESLNARKFEVFVMLRCQIC